MNDDANTRSIPKVEIWYDRNVCSFRIHSYGSCTPSYCDWGIVPMQITNNWKYKAAFNLGNNAMMRIVNLYLYILNDKLTITEVEGDNTSSGVRETFHRVTDRSDPDLAFAPLGRVIHIRGNNGSFVSCENGSPQGMNCNRPNPSTWESFLVTGTQHGKVVLSCLQKYVSSENGSQAITCNRPSPQDWEEFDWIPNCDGTFSLRGNNGLFVSSENGAAPMTCNRRQAGEWEKFTYVF